jgi:membrane-associated phospholipid phosphatase
MHPISLYHICNERDKDMEGIWRWGVDVIVAIQAIHSPMVDVFFNGVTSLGSEEFYLFLLPLLYWCIDKRLAQRLAYLFLFSAYSNAALKGLFRHPRPFEFDPRVLKLDWVPADELGYGFPSGHSQSAITAWGYLAVWVGRRWMWMLAATLVILVAFSRMYLGVHFPTDVLGGLLIGGVWLGLFVVIEPRLEHWLSRQTFGLQIGLALVVPAALLLAYSSGDATAAMGTLIGLGVGIVVEGRAVRFSPGGPIWQRAARFVVGVVGILILREGLKLVFPGEGEALYVFFRVFRYSLVGLWAALAGPWVFQRLDLASSMKAEGGAKKKAPYI